MCAVSSETSGFGRPQIQEALIYYILLPFVCRPVRLLQGCMWINGALCLVIQARSVQLMY